MLFIELACSRPRVAHNVRVVKWVWAGLHLFIFAAPRAGEGFAIWDFIVTIKATF
jgi:hypothetical protein